MDGKTSCIRSILAFVLFCSLLVNNTAIAQAPTLTGRFTPALDANVNGFWEYLPRNYKIDLAQTYPLLIFIHGNGDSGSSPDTATLLKVLNAGTPKVIRNGNFPDSFFTGGKWYKFIVLAPQIKIGFGTTSSIISPSTINALISYAKATYRIDTTRIYMGGLSMGGGATWNYAGSSPAVAKKLAAITVAAGAADLTLQEAGNIADANLPVMATHNTVDDVIAVERTRRNIQLIRSFNPAVVPTAVYWTIPGTNNNKHNVWGRTYEELVAGATPGGSLRDTLRTTVYEWMLQYARPQSTLPLTWKNFQADAKNGAVFLRWETTQELNIRRYEAEKSRDGQTWEIFATLPPKTGADSVKQYTATDNTPYADLTYYRIKQIDLDGNYTYSVIEKTVQAINLAGSLRVYPSPFTRELSIHFFNQEQQQVDIRLSNAAGVTVKQQRFTVSGGGDQTLVLTHLQNLPRGVYIMQIADGKGTILDKKKVFK